MSLSAALEYLEQEGIDLSESQLIILGPSGKKIASHPIHLDRMLSDAQLKIILQRNDEPGQINILFRTDPRRAIIWNDSEEIVATIGEEDLSLPRSMPMIFLQEEPKEGVEALSYFFYRLEEKVHEEISRILQRDPEGLTAFIISLDPLETRPLSSNGSLYFDNEEVSIPFPDDSDLLGVLPILVEGIEEAGPNTSVSVIPYSEEIESEVPDRYLMLFYQRGLGAIALHLGYIAVENGAYTYGLSDVFAEESIRDIFLPPSPDSQDESLQE